MWRNESSGGRGRGEVFFSRALVRGDVDPHCSGLGAREADGGAIVIEVRALALFECLGGWIDHAHACEVVCCLAVRQYVSRRRKSPLILPEVVVTAGRKKKLRSL